MFKRIALTAALIAASTAAFAAPVTYKIDPNHTDVVASWSHFGFSNPIAHFGQVDGSITYDPKNVGTSKVDVTIPLAGLDSHVEKFDEHLRSADFFDAEKYPNITFKSTKVEAAGDKKLRVFGDLTTIALRNGSLQGAYVLMAARALGLDTGPMSGFNNALLDETFFAGTKIKSNFLINLGHGDTAKLFPRSPRLSFDEAARIV